MRQSLPVSFVASGAIGPSSTGTVSIVGLTCRETAGAAAVVRLRNQGKVGGDIIATFNLASGGSLPSSSLPDVKCAKQLYVEVVSGAVEGVAYIV